MLALVTVTAISFGSANQVSAQGSFHGAIYTSKSDGTTVNQNLYDSKADVYLNGGPQNENANGLPDGTYYFQVTDPSGSDLLSTDLAICRQLLVVNGVVSGATGPCPHANGVLNPVNGSTPVQLMPFNDTPNNGGEYKVWLIRQATTTTVDADGITIEFENSNAKTDNFKVKADEDPCVPGEDPECTETVTIGGKKFYDADADGEENENESGIEGIRIEVTLSTSSEPVIVETDANGNWSLGDIPAGTSYSVREILPCVDEDGDQICDPDHYWVQTAPVPDSNNFQGYSGIANKDVTGLDFGDICFGPASGGHTLGFWSNKNGEKIIKANDNYASGLAFLRDLNLKTYDKRNLTLNPDFNPTTYTQLRTWLLDGNAVSMAYMLSVQLAATSLDVRYGFLSDSQIVDARTLGLGIIDIGTVKTLANKSLNDHAITITGDPHRQSQEAMKNFLDGANNNRLSFASPSACSVFYPAETE
jgi:hypothetical protein